jgi:hypothetical protein
MQYKYFGSRIYMINSHGKAKKEGAHTHTHTHTHIYIYIYIYIYDLLFTRKSKKRIRRLSRVPRQGALGEELFK